MGNQKLLSGSSSICGDLPESSRTRARRTRKFVDLDGGKESDERTEDFGANKKPEILRESLPRFLPPPVEWERLQGLGKTTICAAVSAPESTNTILQFVLESVEPKQRRMMQQCAQRCALRGEAGIIRLDQAASTCRVSWNTSQTALENDSERPLLPFVRSELRPQIAEVTAGGTEDPERLKIQP